MKYYFITYQAVNKQGSISLWNKVIDESPMAFIKRMEKFEGTHGGDYRNFVVLNTCKITKDEFEDYELDF